MTPREQAVQLMGLVASIMNPHQWKEFETEMLRCIVVGGAMFFKDDVQGRAERLITKMEKKHEGMDSGVR